jgi:hypothetical protein
MEKLVKKYNNKNGGGVAAFHGRSGAVWVAAKTNHLTTMSMGLQQRITTTTTTTTTTMSMIHYLLCKPSWDKSLVKAPPTRVATLLRKCVYTPAAYMNSLAAFLVYPPLLVSAFKPCKVYTAPMLNNMAALSYAKECCVRLLDGLKASFHLKDILTSLLLALMGNLDCIEQICA